MRAEPMGVSTNDRLMLGNPMDFRNCIVFSNVVYIEKVRTWRESGGSKVRTPQRKLKNDWIELSNALARISRKFQIPGTRDFARKRQEYEQTRNDSKVLLFETCLCKRDQSKLG